MLKTPTAEVMTPKIRNGWQPGPVAWAGAPNQALNLI